MGDGGSITSLGAYRFLCNLMSIGLGIWGLELRYYTRTPGKVPVVPAVPVPCLFRWGVNEEKRLGAQRNMNFQILGIMDIPPFDDLSPFFCKFSMGLLKFKIIKMCF